MQLAEVVAAIAVAGDLGLGQPVEHMLRSCVLATRLADQLGLDQADREATYWVTLFMAAGCVGTSWELSRYFGDDIEFRKGFYRLGAGNLDFLRYLLGHTGQGSPVLSRVGKMATLVLTGMNDLEQSFVAHCAVNGVMAERLGLGEHVVTSLLQTFTRWDGKGLPKGVGGEQLAMPIRLAALVNHLEVIAREDGVEASRATAREHSGTDYDPAVVEAWCLHADNLLRDLDEASGWDTAIAAAPSSRRALSERELDGALQLFADYADLKSPWFTGHSRAVSALAAAAARSAGLPEDEVTLLRRAALVHDIGRAGVPNSIWDKPGPLTPSEQERVRLHAYYTERVLRRAGRLAALGVVASAAHERADGTGYPRAVGAASLPVLGRYLEAADAYQAMLEDRPHRPALGREKAALELRDGARAGGFDGAAVEAVLAAAGHQVRRRPTAAGGMTPREVEVLVLAARGLTTKAIGSQLGIAAKTAGNHLERAYAKAGVGSRAEAALYAMQHGLMTAWA